MNRIINLSPSENVIDGSFADNDIVLVKCDATDEAFSFVMPSAVDLNNVVFLIKKIDSSSNLVTIDFNGAETLDGATSKTLPEQYDSVSVIGDYSVYFEHGAIGSNVIDECIKKDGSTELTNDWDAGSFTITAKGFILGDNESLFLGDGKNGKIYCDTTDLIINPSNVGTGMVKIGSAGEEHLHCARLGVGIEPDSDNILRSAAAAENNSITCDTYSATAHHSKIKFRKSKSDVKGDLNRTANGDVLGAFSFEGVILSGDWRPGGGFYVSQAGNTGAYVPSEMFFYIYTSAGPITPFGIRQDKLSIKLDDYKVAIGRSHDAAFWYDTVNWVFDPKLVGFGVMLANNNSKWCFRDTEIGIYSQADGFLDLFADTAIRFGDSSAGAPTNYASIDSGGKVVFVGNAGLAYGEITAESNSTQTAIAVAGTPVQVTIFDTNGESNNTTPDHTNDHITITKAGVYSIVVSATINSITGVGSKLEIMCKKNNGASDILVHMDRNVGGGGSESGVISMSGAARLAVNDTVEIWIENETNTQNYVVEDISLFLSQVGG